jgi:hypothetical protein
MIRNRRLYSKCYVGEYGARIVLSVQGLVDLFVVGRITGVVNQNPFLRSGVLITPTVGSVKMWSIIVYFGFLPRANIDGS